MTAVAPGQREPTGIWAALNTRPASGTLDIWALLDDRLDLARWAERCRHFSGADIDGLIELAKERALADGLAGTERGLDDADFEAALSQLQPSTLDWLRTVRNVVKYAGDDGSYKDVERYLRAEKLL